MIYNYGLIYEFLETLTPSKIDIAIYYGSIFWNNETFLKPSCETVYNILRKPKWVKKSNVTINWLDYKSFKIRLDNLESLPNYLVYDKQGYFLVIYEYLNDTKTSIIFLAINDIWLNYVLRINKFYAQKILTSTFDEIEFAQNYNNNLSYNQYTKVINQSTANKKINIFWFDPFYQYDDNYSLNNFIVYSFIIKGTQMLDYVNESINSMVSEWYTENRVITNPTWDLKINTKQIKYSTDLLINTHHKYKTSQLINNKPFYIIGQNPPAGLKVNDKVYINNITIKTNIDLDSIWIYDLVSKQPLKTFQNELKRLSTHKLVNNHLITKLKAKSYCNILANKLTSAYLNFPLIDQVAFEFSLNLNKEYKTQKGPYLNNTVTSNAVFLENQLKTKVKEWIDGFNFNELITQYNKEKTKEAIVYYEDKSIKEYVFLKYNKPNNSNWYAEVDTNLYILHYNGSFYIGTTEPSENEINTTNELTLSPDIQTIYEVVLANNTRIKISGQTTINWSLSNVITPTKNKVIYEVNINTPTKTYKELLTFENNTLINEQNKLNTDLKLLNESLAIKESTFKLSQKQQLFNSVFGFVTATSSAIAAPFIKDYGPALALSGVNAVSKSISDLVFLNQHLDNNKRLYNLERQQALLNYQNSITQAQSLVNITDWETTLKHYKITDNLPFIVYELKQNKYDIIINEELKENIGIPCKITKQWSFNNLYGINQFFNPIVDLSHFKQDIIDILVNAFKIV